MLQTCTDIYKVKQGYLSGRRTWEWFQAEEHVTPIENLVWGEFIIKHPVTGRGKAAGVCTHCAALDTVFITFTPYPPLPCTSTGYSPQKVNKLGQQNDQLRAPVQPPSLGTVGANKKFTFRFRSTVVLRCESFRFVFTESSVFYVSTIADSAIIGSARNG